MKKNVFNHPKYKNQYDEEYRLKFKKPIYTNDPLEVLNRLMKTYPKSKKTKRNNFFTGSSGSRIFDLPVKNQNVVFKMTYSNTMASHNQYKNYYMPQINKDTVTEKPELFGMDDEEYDKYKVGLNFKCIISPENQEIDLPALVESYIKRLELQTGYSLCWKAVVHQDTGHRHAHVLINGKDQNNEDVFFRPETIKMMRYLCSNAATQMIGERSEKEIELEKKNLIKKKGWTFIDENILKIAQENEMKISSNFLSSEFSNRLLFLSDLKLVQYNNQEKNWNISKDFKEVLQASSRYDSFLTEYNKDRKNPIKLYSGGILKGKVEKTISFDEDESWNDAIIINTGNERVYVPVNRLYKKNLKEKNITIKNTSKGTKLSKQITDKNIYIEK